MADITLTIPNGVLSRVVDAIAARNAYNPAIHGTKAQFAKTVLIRWIKEEVRGYEANLAAAAAANTASDSVDTDITLS